MSIYFEIYCQKNQVIAQAGVAKRCRFILKITSDTETRKRQNVAGNGYTWGTHSLWPCELGGGGGGDGGSGTKIKIHTYRSPSSCTVKKY